MQFFSAVAKPTQLTDDIERGLLQEYLASSASVWNKDYIKSTLLSMTHDKCIYCECKIAEESKYLEVDHFEDKNHFPGKVIDWLNLLPSCKRCNGSKSDHNVIQVPIVNPSVDIPQEHLRLKLYRFHGKTTVGNETIEVLGLNDLERLALLRFKIGAKAQEILEHLFQEVQSYTATPGDVRASNRLKKKILALLQQGLKTEEYCSTISTILKHHEKFNSLKLVATEKGLWSDQAEERYNEICTIAYDE